MKSLLKAFTCVAIMGGLALAMTGCDSNLGNVIEKTVENVTDSTSSSNLSEAVHHETDLKNFDTVQLNIDMEVCDVTIVEAEDNTLLFDQKANKKSLLAKMDVNEKGKEVEVSFVVPNQGLINNGNQTSNATLKLPKGPIYIINGSIDVGDLKVNATSNQLKSLEASLNVGSLTLDASNAQPNLTSIKADIDVGNSVTKLGACESLADIDINVNVGNAEIELFEGLDQNVGLVAASSVGDVILKMAQGQKASIKCELDEFVSDVSITNHEFDMTSTDDDERYNITGNGTFKGHLKLDASIQVGSLIVK